MPRGSRTKASRKSGRRLGWGSAQRTRYAGEWYASKSEARYAAHLDLMVKAGKVARWDRQVKWPLVVNGVRVCGMVPDFRVWLDDVRYELHEVKGHPTPVWRLKHKLFSALHPDVPYVVVRAGAVPR